MSGLRAVLPGLLLLVLQSTTSAIALERTALVVGNSAYGDAPLRNPVNDATDVARVLEKQLGFDVILRTDVTQQQFEAAAREFRQRLQRSGGVGLFYYAGHGIQADGHNYLIPVGANIDSETDVKYKAVDAGYVLGYMDEADASLNIVILDACRNNPYERSFRSASRGLVRLEMPAGELGSLLAYSTAPGNVAADGSGRNSPYTAQLVKALKTPNLTLEQVFKQVAIGVYQQTNHQQKPWTSQFLLGDFYFLGSQPTAVAKAPQKVTPTPAEPPKRSATLTVRSNVYGDQVSIDGRRSGSTRLDVKLAPGWHTVRVEKEGYTPYEQRIELAAGRNALVRAQLERETSEPAQTPESPPKPPTETWTEPVTGMEFVWIPPGCVDMGSPQSEAGRDDDERQHRVCVEGFWLGRHEVTNVQYRRFRDAHHSGEYRGQSLNGDDHPVVGVDWYAATAFAALLSQETGERFRLPTEAEWEYAARAGTETARYWGDAPEEACAYANVYDRTAEAVLGPGRPHHACEDSFAVSAPVGHFQPNGFGLYDMLGNVAEWTCSIYDRAYREEEGRCAEPNSNGERVIRSGSWFTTTQYVRSAHRKGFSPHKRSHYFGFRLARIP